MAIVCHLPGCDGIDLPGTTISDFLTHQRTTHLSVDVPDLNDWRTRALAAARAAAASGAEFQMWEITRLIGDPPDHKTAMGAFAREIEHLGIAHVVGYRKSDRPETKGSAVAVWRGGPKPRQESAA